MLPETDIAGALVAAEKLRALCADAPFHTSTGALDVTASFGVAELRIDSARSRTTRSPRSLLRRADAALYTSKNEGTKPGYAATVD